MPPGDPNPLNAQGETIDKMIQMKVNDDLWNQMKGNLPCTDATTLCIKQLQQSAVQHNPLLKEVDTRVEEIQGKIDEAKANNRTSIKLSLLRPAARVFLDPTFNTATSTTTQTRGPIQKIAEIFTSPVGILNELFKAVGVPFLDSFFGGSDANQQRAISISDLAVQLAQIQRSRAELADQVKEKVSTSVFEFDTARREFQIAQEISKREAARMQLISVDYRLGQGESTSYLSSLSAIDRNKASSFKSWSQMRSHLERMKLLVLGEEEQQN